MGNLGIVKEKIEIDASVKKAWHILSQTEYSKQWDDLPENFAVKEFTEGDIIEWEGYS